MASSRIIFSAIEFHFRSFEIEQFYGDLFSVQIIRKIIQVSFDTDHLLIAYGGLIAHIGDCRITPFPKPYIRIVDAVWRQ